MTILRLNRLLNSATLLGHLEIAKILLKKGADVNNLYGFPLRWAANNGNIDLVKLYIQNRAIINIYHSCPLRWASHEGKLEVVKFLLENGARDTCDGLAYYQASKFNYTEIMNLLLKYKRQ